MVFKVFRYFFYLEVEVYVFFVGEFVIVLFKRYGRGDVVGFLRLVYRKLRSFCLVFMEGFFFRRFFLEFSRFVRRSLRYGEVYVSYWWMVLVGFSF